jgi:hypothetical protein
MTQQVGPPGYNQVEERPPTVKEPLVLDVPCPVCQALVPAPFPYSCPHCFATFDGLLGSGTSAFQTKNSREHRDLLYGQNVQLYRGREYNCSFDHYGEANLPDLVQYTLSYGHRTTVPSNHGNVPTVMIAAYIPDIIGSGVSKYNTAGPLPASGVMLVSPASLNYAHSFPVLDDYMQHKFATAPGGCSLCKKPTGFGHGICADCYAKRSGSWLDFQ